MSVNHNVQSGDISEIVVSMRRVIKVVKGGARFSFCVMVVAGDGRGLVGFGIGKGREVSGARAKASSAARKSLIRVPLRRGKTLHHDVVVKCGAGHVMLRSAKPGTGIVAGGAMRSIFECLGIKDVVAKSIGSSNPYSVVRTTFNALQAIKTPRYAAEIRNKRISEVVRKEIVGG